MKRADFCDEAKRIITTDRNEQYGEPEDNFAVIAELWSAYLVHRCGIGEIEPADVGIMMALFKIGRAATAYEVKDDTYVDAIGYLACAGEIESTAREIVDRAVENVRESAEAAKDFEAIADSVDEKKPMHGDEETVPHVCATCKVSATGIFPCPKEANCAACTFRVQGVCRCQAASMDPEIRSEECPMWIAREETRDMHGDDPCAECALHGLGRFCFACKHRKNKANGRSGK